MEKLDLSSDMYVSSKTSFENVANFVKRMAKWFERMFKKSEKNESMKISF